jgi:ABC-2 type transport system ATP-binding protein
MTGRPASPPLSPPLLEVRDLRKSYGKVTAVDGVSFSVERGTCFGLLGPNGAGKTTTIEIIESILEPDSGTVFYKGRKIDRSFKEQIGIQFQSTALQEFLTVRETLELFSKLYETHKPLEDIIRICSLDDIIRRDNRKLSGGQRQRMLLGIALINDPELLFLDEPTTGLDPQARRNFWRLIDNIKKEDKTVILTTHYMDEAEALCEQIVVMDQGRIIEQGRPKELLKKHFGEATLVLPEKAFPPGTTLSCPGETRDGMRRVRCEDMNATIRELLDKAVSLEGLAVERQNLDDLFLKLTGGRQHLAENGSGEAP